MAPLENNGAINTMNTQELRKLKSLDELYAEIDQLQAELGECQVGWATGQSAIEDNLRLIKERDELRAKLAALEKQEPVAVLDASTQMLRGIGKAIPPGAQLYLSAGAQPRVPELTADHIRSVGGIVHGDGNIFFTNLQQLHKAMLAAAPEPTK